MRNFTDQGKLSGSQSLAITVALSLRDPSDLAQKLGEMYSPANVMFHHFMTPTEFRARYAPTSDQVQQVEAYLSAHGIEMTSLNENGYLLRARGAVSSLNTAFQTEIHQYQDSQGNTYFAPATEPQLPTGLGIQAVHGLHNVTRWKSYAHPRLANSTPAHAGTGTDGGFAPADIKTAYKIPTTVTGSGQTLGLMELDGYTASDIATYETKFGLPAVPLQNVLVDSATGSAGSGAAEVTLDIELMTALAPGASAIRVYEAPNDSQAILDVYAKIASDNLATTVSSSWGSSEDTSSSAFADSEDTIFEQMAAQGQSIFVAAGDDGADDNGTSLSVDDPASQPYVVGVGGTTLTTGTSQAYVSETTWYDASGSIDGGGGGISSTWKIPTWQSGLATTTNLASSTMRNVPDVSLNADPNTGYAIYEAGTWGSLGRHQLRRAPLGGLHGARESATRGQRARGARVSEPDALFNRRKHGQYVGLSRYRRQKYQRSLPSGDGIR